MPFQIANEARGRTVETCHRLAWKVIVGCDNGHSTTWRANDLPEMFPPQTTLEQVAERLVCKVCGSTDGSLGIQQDTGAQQARDVDRFNAKP